ncbi:transposase [Microbacterium sp. ISL-59]|uniref:transposase n=1 Tax=Microbacterium sp. ISL-59 TaxID=2819159 RepID=UPI001BE8EE50|nr:transposase [Microbacterium sp. ISL-59]MBT2495328.1 transposase [Microbacterium sp. ISL-59]
MADPTFEEIAAALYAGPPEAFVSSRKARAESVDDRELATRIRALRKPSVAAWVVNVFAQERAGQLGEALQLAAELREAQDDLDAPALAKLGRERRALTRHLAEMAAELAGSRGEKITPATREAVEGSISAAFFAPAAAGAVASGRLVRAIEPSASTEDIRDAVAGEIPELESVPQRPPDELQARRLRRDAERQLASVEKEHKAAERELTMRDAAMQELQTRATDLARSVAELEAQLAKTRAEAERVGEELPQAKERQADARQQAKAAAGAVTQAQKSLDRL